MAVYFAISRSHNCRSVVDMLWIDGKSEGGAVAEQ
jgi:hypothetical protein